MKDIKWLGGIEGAKACYNDMSDACDNGVSDACDNGVSEAGVTPGVI